MVNNIVLKNMNSYGVHGRIGLNGRTYNLMDFAQAENFVEALQNCGVSAELEYFGGFLYEVLVWY